MSDVLPLAERRRIELGCEWADGEEGAGPAWRGDPGLMGLLLRNLLDNAVRYAPEGSGVTLRFGRDIVAVENTAPADLDPTQMANWGERFHRPDGQAESGSGLGVSIARRIAELHRLALGHRIDTDTAGGVRVIAELSAR
jgi:two-component system sensor histidine kinase QseC